jgi:uncharacterized membrane protein YeaQ/YmgE (transglycosylase-associated protein family)
MLTFLIVMILSGAIIGGLARLALPGPDPMGFFATVALGIAGSFIAGLVVYAVSGSEYGAGLPISILASTVILYFIRRSRGGGLTEPGDNPRLRRRRF